MISLVQLNRLLMSLSEQRTKLKLILTWWFATVSGALCNRIWSDNQSTLNGVRNISHCTDSGRCRSYKKQDILYSTVSQI